MQITINTDEIANKTDFRPGSRGYFGTEENPLIIIGEDDSHVWTILDRGGVYYGVFKAPDNLAAIHITELPKEPQPLTLGR